MAPRPSRAERRRRILAAARTVFARRGYAGARVSDVAAEARVGKGTIYEYFRGKEDLFATLVVVVARDSLETLARHGPSGDPERDLRDTIRYLVEETLGDNLDLYRLFFDFWGASQRRAEAQRQLGEVEAGFRAFVRGLVAEGQHAGVFRPEVDPEQFVYALSAAVDGLSLRLVMLRQDVDLSAYARCLQDLFVGGLLTERSLKGASILTEREK